ncbi:hypothetical protein SanaruYs_06400 [Chryseotalea sanaruensis]|uniref:Uncharacterized protein n=1 Tax=Chryseotalea sanaruensis TaxID=2482724 RepID=A0A401U6A7_9BACT|nr:hypothetical protein SanaruYs_06400 [Chryseotalea sanaruensis]
MSQIWPYPIAATPIVQAALPSHFQSLPKECHCPVPSLKLRQTGQPGGVIDEDGLLIQRAKKLFMKISVEPGAKAT